MDLFVIECENIVSVSGLLAIMSMGIIINQKYDVLAKRLSVKYNKLWLGAEIFLFVLVGIAVDLKYALSAGFVVILLVVVFLNDDGLIEQAYDKEDE